MDTLRQTPGGPVLASLARGAANTPVLGLGRFGKATRVPLFLKLEHLAPTGSGKDRLALAALEELRASNRLQAGQPIVVASTGNAAVSMAWAAATRGHRVHAAIPRASSLEFRQLLELYRARYELTPSELGVAGARERARVLAQELGGCLWDPFADDVGIAGLKPLAEELLAFEGQLEKPLAAVVCGLGSGITLAALKRFAPGLPLVGVEPEESAAHAGSPRGPHKVHGIGVGFRSAHLDGMRVVTVPAQLAWTTKRRVAAEEGLFIGPTTGAVLAAMERLASDAAGPLLGLAMDSGERTFSLEALVP